jgi:hypothetical protein
MAAFPYLVWLSELRPAPTRTHESSTRCTPDRARHRRWLPRWLVRPPRGSCHGSWTRGRVVRVWRSRCCHHHLRSPGGAPAPTTEFSADAAWSTVTAQARHSPPHPAARLLPSSLSTAPKHRLLVIAVLHQVGSGRRQYRVFKCFRRMFRVFHLDVVYVAMTIYVYCKRMFHIISICFKCFKRMFQVFYLDVTEVDLDVA